MKPTPEQLAAMRERSRLQQAERQAQTEGNLALKPQPGQVEPQPQSEADPDTCFFEHRLTAKHLQKDVDYLIEGFLVRQSLNMIYARASQGKSYFSISVALHLIRNGTIRRVIYCDMDNSTMALKARKFDAIIEQHKEQLIYIHRAAAKIGAADLIELFNAEASRNQNRFDGYLIVLDSIRDFLQGRDMNTDRDIIPLLDSLKGLREAGATVIFLHHSKKSKEENDYKGATTFVDSVDCAFGLKKDSPGKGKISFALTIEKDRLPVQDSGFALDTESFKLEPCAYELACIDEDDNEFIANVREALSDGGPKSQTKLLEEIGLRRDDRKGRKLLEKFTGHFWTVTQTGAERNAKLYSLIP